MSTGKYHLSIGNRIINILLPIFIIIIHVSGTFLSWHIGYYEEPVKIDWSLIIFEIILLTCNNHYKMTMPMASDYDDVKFIRMIRFACVLEIILYIFKSFAFIFTGEWFSIPRLMAWDLSYLQCLFCIPSFIMMTRKQYGKHRK